MTDAQFSDLMLCLGFGFGSIFWFALTYVIVAWHGRS